MINIDKNKEDQQKKKTKLWEQKCKHKHKKMI